MNTKYLGSELNNFVKMFVLLFGIMSLFVLPMNTVHAATPQSAVDLGTAGNFVILAKSGISTTGTTSITGDIGVSPIASTAITGFGLVMDSSNQFATSSRVTGKVYASNYAAPTPTKMTTAISDMQTAYTDAAGRTLPDYTNLGSGNIGGLTLAPGLYKWTTGVIIPADVTLSGGPNDIWIFQVAGTLSISSGKKVILSGGAQAKNVFWQVAGKTTLGTSSVFNGNVLDQTAIVLNTGARLNGRALAQTAVTLDSNMVSLPPSNSSNNTCTPNQTQGCKVCNINGTAWIDNSSNCLINQTCINGTCTANCTTHSTQNCFNNDIYWFNSCNIKEGIYQDCGNNASTTNYRCNGNWTQRQMMSKGCLNSLCYNNIVWKDTQNCASVSKVCLNGACVTCTPNQTQGCKVCNSAGSAWVDNSSKCSSGQVCRSGSCVSSCTPKTCSTLGNYICGSWSNGCNGTINCGTCSANKTCSVGKCVSNCNNECSVSGAKQCSGSTGYKICGNYDTDTCLEWSTATNCGKGKICQNGSCRDTCTCQNDCTSSGLEQCSGNGYKTCGNYDSDSCLEWSEVTTCLENQTCSNGACLNVNASTNGTRTIHAKITAGKWDAYEKNGAMSVSAKILSTGKYRTVTYRSGYIFTNLEIPKGATILSAKLLVPYNWRSGANANTILYGEAVDNSGKFTNTVNNITNRQKTSSSVYWNNLPSANWGKFITSPDVSGIVGEITGRVGWTSGNSLAILQYEAANATNTWEAVSYEGCGGENCTAILQVQYSS